GDAGEIAGPPRGRRHRRGAESRRVLPRALVVAEEEKTLLYDRTAEGAASDVLLPLLLRRARSIVLPGVRVEVAVPIELEGVAAELIRPRLDDARDDRAADIAGIGGVVVRFDADLRERVRTRLVRDAVVDGLVDVEAVDREVVRLLAVPVDEGA